MELMASCLSLLGVGNIGTFYQPLPSLTFKAILCSSKIISTCIHTDAHTCTWYPSQHLPLSLCLKLSTEH